MVLSRLELTVINYNGIHINLHFKTLYPVWYYIHRFTVKLARLSISVVALRVQPVVLINTLSYIHYRIRWVQNYATAI